MGACCPTSRSGAAIAMILPRPIIQRLKLTDSVEKLLSGGEAIFSLNLNAAENPRKTRAMTH
jgi:hypothetical protein